MRENPKNIMKMEWKKKRGKSYSSNNEEKKYILQKCYCWKKNDKKNWYKKENHKIILIKEKEVSGTGKLNDAEKGCGKRAEIHNSRRCRLFKWDCTCALFSRGKTSIKIVCRKIRWVELTTGWMTIVADI